MSWNDYWPRCFKVFCSIKFFHRKKTFLDFSSSDSDSDPEGGELPDINGSKDEQERKKTFKKKRSDLPNDERQQKFNRKRQVNIFISLLQWFSLLLLTNQINNLLTLRLRVQNLSNHHRNRWELIIVQLSISFQWK
jgi:hypothetical protein